MPQELTTTSIKTLLKFPFKEQDWKSRFLVGSLLVLACFVIPLAPWLFVYGYYIRLMRRASKGEELALPVWGDWSGLARDGIQGSSSKWSTCCLGYSSTSAVYSSTLLPALACHCC
jgi:hypothetical protein